MVKIIVYIATSNDGYIADEHGSVDWLPQNLEETGGLDYGYHEFYDSVDALVMGRKTYEQILGFGDWPYPGKPSFIFSRQSLTSTNQDIQFVNVGIERFIRELERGNIKILWVVGGDDLIKAFYTQGRVDEFIVTVFPTVLQKGIPLSTLKTALKKDELVKFVSTDFGDGVLQNHYKK